MPRFLQERTTKTAGPKNIFLNKVKGAIYGLINKK